MGIPTIIARTSANVYPATLIRIIIPIYLRIGKLARSTALVGNPWYTVVLCTDLSLLEGTANLIIHMLSVDRKWVHPLPMDVPTVIPNTGGVTVTLIEANHCT